MVLCAWGKRPSLSSITGGRLWRLHAALDCAGGADLPPQRALQEPQDGSYKQFVQQGSQWMIHNGLQTRVSLGHRSDNVPSQGGRSTFGTGLDLWDTSSISRPGFFIIPALFASFVRFGTGESAMLERGLHAPHPLPALARECRRPARAPLSDSIQVLDRCQNPGWLRVPRNGAAANA